MSRDKGANGERAVVNFAADCGVPSRRVIRTATSRDPDEGDVWLWEGRVVVQVKVGEKAKHASLEQVSEWLREVEVQATRVPECDLVMLVRQSPGAGVNRPQRWTATMRLTDFLFWTTGATFPGLTDMRGREVSMPLGDALAVLGDTR